MSFLSGLFLLLAVLVGLALFMTDLSIGLGLLLMAGLVGLSVKTQE